MMTLKQLITKMAKKTEDETSTKTVYEERIAGLKLANNVLKEKLGQVESENSLLRERIVELETELSQIREYLRFEREKSALEINQLEEELKVAQIQIEELKGTIKKLQHDKYGCSSEKNKYLENDNSKLEESANKLKAEQEQKEFEKNVRDIKTGADEVAKKRKKGAEKGHKGHGRRIPKNLKKETYIFELPEKECKCPICGKKYRLIKEFSRKSHEIELKMELLLKEYEQLVYERECNCDRNAPLLTVAPKPESIIYKSAFTTNTWCRLLAIKYLTGIPVNRVNELINEPEYTFNPSTILGGFEKLLEIMMPLYKAILRYNQNESHWHADETRWCRLLDSESKKRRLYWVWVFVGKKSVAYITDPTRSKNVPEEHFKNTKAGILSVDRLASYNIVSDRILLAYCWYHLRRDFINIGRKYKDLMWWSIKWILKIREIERINRRRVQKNSDYDLIDRNIQNELLQKVNQFFQNATEELTQEDLKKEQKKTFKSLLSRKDGYTIFVEHPDIPMHNNVAEGQFRHVAQARNSYGGSKSEWGGELAAVTWTIFKTAEINGLNPVDYLLHFFQKYIELNGFNDDIPEEILPWNFIEPKILPDLRSTG